jgi:hypothetical protein
VLQWGVIAWTYGDTETRGYIRTDDKARPIASFFKNALKTSKIHSNKKSLNFLVDKLFGFQNTVLTTTPFECQSPLNHLAPTKLTIMIRLEVTFDVNDGSIWQMAAIVDRTLSVNRFCWFIFWPSTTVFSVWAVKWRRIELTATRTRHENQTFARNGSV